MKGVLLCGGKGTRLLPATKLFNKHMIPILNRPMIMYPLETLKALGVREIMIVTGGNHVGGIADFLGDGSDFGVTLTYRIQKEAGGIGQALGLAKDFVGKDAVAVILGDNIFDNTKVPKTVPRGVGTKEAMFFFSKQKDNSRFGVPVFKKGIMGQLLTIEEKPFVPKSEFAVTGLYIYPPTVFNVIPKLKPSKRGEIEISDVNNYFIRQKKCAYHFLAGFWSDAGTPESLMEVTEWAYKDKNSKV